MPSGLATAPPASPRLAPMASAAQRKIRSCARRVDSEPPAARAARFEPPRVMVLPLASALARSLVSGPLRALVEYSTSSLPAHSVRRAGTEWPRPSACLPWAPPPPTLRPTGFGRHWVLLSPELAQPPAAAAARGDPLRDPARKSPALRYRLPRRLAFPGYRRSGHRQRAQMAPPSVPPRVASRLPTEPPRAGKTASQAEKSLQCAEPVAAWAALPPDSSGSGVAGPSRPVARRQRSRESACPRAGRPEQR